MGSCYRSLNYSGFLWQLFTSALNRSHLGRFSGPCGMGSGRISLCHANNHISGLLAVVGACTDPLSPAQGPGCGGEVKITLECHPESTQATTAKREGQHSEFQATGTAPWHAGTSDRDGNSMNLWRACDGQGARGLLREEDRVHLLMWKMVFHPVCFCQQVHCLSACSKPGTIAGLSGLDRDGKDPLGT